ncbi:predicted protein [Uncinocarpus reesii 1704]|uniref:Nuclear pore complex protein Nup85 n=1 Tax=Uncinocarpus reesii (strain UAMH 1704) TaxID=336963 RepID=C4JPS4_UNCRE|nr:uncharacterized protein UREG_04567 [Uncinocarpus reesii 1704]EEP79721.1 predicted protein [Uncinocarpus reesii 1704]
MDSQCVSWLSALKQNPQYNQKAVEALQPYIQGTVSASDAARALIDLHDTSVEDLWAILLGLATDIPSASGSIIGLLNAIFNAPNKYQARSLSDNDVETSFSWEWREVHDSLWSDFTSIESTSDPAVQPWINYNIFSAQCVSNGIVGSHWALHHIVEGLEKDLSDPLPPQQEVNMLVAQQYFVHSANYLLQNPPRKADGSYETSWGNYSSHRLSNEGLTKDRWNFWKERWDSARRVESASETLVGGSARALEAMDEAERGMDW